MLIIGGGPVGMHRCQQRRHVGVLASNLALYGQHGAASAWAACRHSPQEWSVARCGIPAWHVQKARTVTVCPPEARLPTTTELRWL